MINFIFILKAVLMGIVEGLTEFLPISSTGHLIIVGHIISFSNNKEFKDMFEQVIQLGAILAIIVLYWKKIWTSLKHLKPGDFGFKLWSTIFVAVLPLSIGLVLSKFIDKYLMDNILSVALAMIVGGILLFVIENKYRNKAKIKSMDSVTYKQAFIIGCFQCLAMWPGMSRSASTIMGGWIVGLTSFAAAEFSFFLSIPTMVGMAFLKLIKFHWQAIGSIEILSLVIGFIVSFMIALIVVEKFIDFLKKKPMRVFSVYRILAGILLLILVFTNIM